MVKKLFLILSLAFMSFEVVGQNEDEMVMVVETAPVYGGDLNSFITDNIHYPISAIKDSIEGTVYVEFYIDTVGGTFKHRVLRGVRNDLDEEALRVTRLIRFDSPAKQRGKPIIIRYFVPVRFVLNRKEKILSCSSDLIAQSPETREVFDHEPKRLPYYEGGYEKMYEFIFSNIDMGDIDSSAFDGRRIFVGFTIDTLGNTHDHRILKGSVGKRCDDALIDACKLLHFLPAIGYDDKPQNYEFNVVIQFGQKQNEENKCFFRRIFKKKCR
ncbi:MAG: TonB family protein [Bacteroidales bacterium]|nr:TonB family protein [Bacteroidales bacterium]